jgi:hypothetical protein
MEVLLPAPIEAVRSSETLENIPADDNKLPFITANTVACTLDEVKNHHIIPVFTKDNEPLISHIDFVEASEDILSDVFKGEQIHHPSLRLSHPIKGRIPDAKDKPAALLQEWEKTLYYERMMFIVEIPSIHDTIGGQTLSLTFGGVKAYNQDNLYSRSICDQHFKIFIGFKNRICTNLCVWTDGYMDDLKIKNIGQLKSAIRTLVEGYNKNFHLFHLKRLIDFSVSESQFAQLIGRCRMYNYLPNTLKSAIPPILFGDQQIGTLVKDYYRENSFTRDVNGDINLWKLYNLFTGVNKSSYIDSFLDRGINAFNLVEDIRRGLESKEDCWFLN